MILLGEGQLISKVAIHVDRIIYEH